MKTVDEQVMNVFDTEFEKMRYRVFGQVEEICLENDMGELDDHKFNQYECYYIDLISNQFKKSGISPLEIERSV